MTLLESDRIDREKERKNMFPFSYKSLGRVEDPGGSDVDQDELSRILDLGSNLKPSYVPYDKKRSRTPGEGSSSPKRYRRF